MDILIEGTGAMACLFAARFSQHGMRVTMAGRWQEAIRTIQEEGVRLREDDGAEQTYPVRVVQRDCECEPHGQALVLVKSWQTESSARNLKCNLSSQGLALTLQNGLGNYEKLSNILGPERVSLGTTTAGATLLGPGRVQAVGKGAISLASHPRLEPLADSLSQAGFSIKIVNDPLALLWGKLIINAAINPLTALLRIPNGELLNRPHARALMVEAAMEAAAVAIALQINLPNTDPVELVEGVVRSTAKNHSSMLQDIMRGTPTEVDAINGAVVRAGEDLGVAVDVNRTLWKLVKAMERQAVPSGQ